MSILEELERRRLLSQSWIVAPSGLDSNPGTLNLPFQTIQAAANHAQPGDFVLIRAGTYHETVTPPRSGTAGMPITFAAYNGEQVVVSGADPVSGWTYNSGQAIYKAAQPWSMGDGNNQVFVDGQMINEARYPNTSLDVSHPVTATVSGASNSAPDNGWLYPSAATITDPNLPGGIGAWNGATIHIGSGQAWVVQTGTVLSSNSGTLTYSFEHLTSYELPTAGNQYYITNSFQALDSPGEWYRDPNTGQLYVWTPTGDSPANHDVQAQHRLYAFELSGRSYISISGLAIFAASIDTDSGSNYVGINALYAEHISQQTLDPVPWDSHDTRPTTGIQLNGSHDVLQNSIIAYSSGDGVYIGGSDNTVQNCVIHDVDYAGSDAAGIEVSGTRQQILGNTIYNSGRSGLTASFSTADKILNNTIHDVGLQLTDLGGIYTWGTDSQGTEIANNTIYNIHTGGFGAGGVYLDNGSANFLVHDNTIYNVDHPLKVNPPATANSIYSNNVSGGTNEVSDETTPADGTGGGVTDLGTFGGFTSEGQAINNAGQVTGVANGGTSISAFRYGSGVMSNLGGLGGTYSVGTAINNAGTVAGAAYPAAGPRHAAVFANGQVSDLGTLAGDVASEATGINDLGQVVGFSYGNGSVGRAFTWANGAMQAIATLGGTINAAFGVNDSGYVVGSSTLAGDQVTHAFVLRNGTLTDLGTLGGSGSYALAINNAGQIVGQSYTAGNGAIHAFLYSNGSMQDLGTLANLPNSVATGINANGDVVGYAYNATTFTQHAFVYHNGTMVDLNALVPTNGWTFTAANAINDSGQITGGGNNPSGYHRAFTVQAFSTAPAANILGAATPSGSAQNVSDSSIPGAGGVELGVKFRSDVAGSITGVRFWKGSLNTGIHTGELWSSSGQLLATATFTSETASGWQQVSFSSAVTIAANTTYIVSYHTAAASISYSPGALTAAINNPPLHALASGTDGANGVYRYGASAFPTSSNGAAPSYWVDVVYSTTVTSPPPPAPTASTILGTSGPAAAQQNANDPSIPGAGGVELGTKFRSDVAGTITGVRFWKGSLNTGVHTGELWSSTGQLLASATFSGESASDWQQVNFASPVAIAAGTTYVVSYHTTASYLSYSPGAFAAGGIDSPPLHALAKGVDGNNGVYVYGARSFPTLSNGQSPNYWVDVAFSPSAAGPQNLFGSTAPAAGQQNVNDPTIPASGGVELGVKFRSDVAGTVTGVRFWKGSQTTGVQTCELWTGTGQLLATATFTNETASGWQQVSFSSPVTIAANTTYIVSYHTTSAYIAYTPGTFSSSALNSGSLHALQSGTDGGNSVYKYGASGFPSLYNGQGANYWVDVDFTALFS